MRNLNITLENIRKQFPRFYFLSNDDLLNLIAKSKNPQSLKNSLNKVFESDFSLIFDQENRIIALDASEEKLNLV